MEALVMIGLLILGLTIIVGLHELGHMLTAKWFGMRVEKYAIGFPPKVVSKQIGETEYMIGAIPLGGFVKISGMVDESLDTEKLSAEPQPWEFRAKPAWQRLIVMMGGIIVNILSGILIFILLAYFYGDKYVPASEARHGIIANELAQEIGLKTGDKIVMINGKPFDEFEDIYGSEVLLGKNSYYTVERDGKLIDVKVPANFMDRILDEKNKAFITIRQPFQVGKVRKGLPAAEAGLQEGDFITAIDGQPVTYFNEFQEKLWARAGQPVDLTVKRGDSVMHLGATVAKDSVLGFEVKPLLKLATKEYSFGEAVPKGTVDAFTIITDNIKGFGKIFRGEVSASKSVSGPIGIAQIFGSAFDSEKGIFNWEKFWRIVGMLSMVIAFMNFLPIPALDGGHVMFLTYEMVSGRKPSDKFMENAQKVGMVLLLGLMAFAIFNDVFKLFT